MTNDDQNEAITPDSVSEPPFAPEGDGGLGDLGSLLGGGDGGLDFGALMEQASDLQSRMLAAQEELQQTEVEGVAGGGAVRITVTGGHEFRAVRIDPAAVDADEVEMLQDLVLAALNDAVSRIDELQAESAGPEGLGIDLGGLFGG